MSYRFLRFPEGKTKTLTLSYDDGVGQDARLSALRNLQPLSARKR